MDFSKLQIKQAFAVSAENCQENRHTFKVRTISQHFFLSFTYWVFITPAHNISTYIHMLNQYFKRSWCFVVSAWRCGRLDLCKGRRLKLALSSITCFLRRSHGLAHILWRMPSSPFCTFEVYTMFEWEQSSHGNLLPCVFTNKQGA